MNRTNLLVFIGIVVVCLIISLFSLSKCNKAPADPNAPTAEAEAPAIPATASESPVEPAEPASEEPAEPETPAPTETAADTPDEPSEEDSGEEIAFTSPAAAIAAVTDAVGKKSLPTLQTISEDGAISAPAAARLTELFGNAEVNLDSENPPAQIAKAADSERWQYNLLQATEPVDPLYVDISKLSEKDYGISRIGFGLSVTMSDDPSSETSPPVGAAEDLDALTIAHAFSKAVVASDFSTARSLADPAEVTDERVADLIMAMEEGDFSLREERPLVVTLARDDLAWVLARVNSSIGNSEFAIELGPKDESWLVNDLTFSKVISSLASRAGAGGIPYAPLVENPSGGDSLVIYFDFDNSGINERADRQLAIISKILGEDSDRVIRITGHADALGSDQYNAALSQERAESIRQALINAGVAPAQVVTEGYGETKPRKPNFLPDGSDNPTGRSQNRRAEVYLDF
ncbi:MAG: OmpA family protein [Verrucomicrobiota bacterium]